LLQNCSSPLHCPRPSSYAYRERERKRDFRKKCKSSCTFKRSLRERDREREQKYSSLMPFSSAHTTNKYQVVPGTRRDGSFEKGKWL
jgi:hypothetical protein